MHENIEDRAGSSLRSIPESRRDIASRWIFVVFFLLCCLGAGATLSVADEQSRQPDSLQRDTSASKGESAAEDQLLTEDEVSGICSQYLETHKDEYGLADPAKDLTESRVSIDKHRSATIRYDQIYKGIPVAGGGMIIFIRGGRVDRILNHLKKGIDLDIVSAMTKEQALDIALRKFEPLCDSVEIHKTQYFIMKGSREDKIHLTWYVVLRCTTKLEARAYHIDALTGEIFAENDGKKR